MSGRSDWHRSERQTSESRGASGSQPPGAGGDPSQAPAEQGEPGCSTTAGQGPSITPLQRDIAQESRRGEDHRAGGAGRAGIHT